MPDGRVAVIGGHFRYSDRQPVNSSEFVDVAAGTSVLTGTFNVPRTTSGPGPTVMLANGTILSGSSWVAAGEAAIPAEIFDPASGAWSRSGVQTAPGGIALALPDGRVLVAGGIDWTNELPIDRAEVWEAATGQWSRVGALPAPRTGHSMVLAGGQALVFGGFSTYPRGMALGTSLRFDAVSGTWGEAASMIVPRGVAASVVLRDGRVLVAGGTQTSGSFQPIIASTETYDPATNSWQPAAPMHEARALHTLTLLADGRVLAAGGSSESFMRALRSAEIFDPVTGTWTLTVPMASERQGSGAVRLANGEVLIIGGYPDGLRTTEIFTP